MKQKHFFRHLNLNFSKKVIKNKCFEKFEFEFLRNRGDILLEIIFFVFLALHSLSQADFNK